MRAVVNHAEKEVRKKLRDRATHREGYEALNWVLLDYVDVVMHIFRPNFRDYYRLEDLWSDADCVEIADEAAAEKFIKLSGKAKTVRKKAARPKKRVVTVNSEQ